MNRIDAADEAECNRVQSVLAARELERQQAYDRHRQREWADSPQLTAQTEGFLDTAWNWLNHNQIELSFDTGVAIGAVAAIGLVAGIITAPAWLVIGGVALLTAGIITAGTLAINHHFGLEPSANLADNIITGVVPALALTGAGYLLAAVAPIVGTAITNTCANNPTACSYIGPVVDFGEQAILATQMAYYGLTNDQENLAMTTIEWQMELNDGGLPGNTLTHEASEQLSRLSPEALELVGQYGDEVISLLLNHGDEAVGLLQKGFPPSKNWINYVPESIQSRVEMAFEGTPSAITPSAITLTEDLSVYRYWSDIDRQQGSWATLDPNLSPEEARAILALPNDNYAYGVTQFIIPEGATILIGEAAEQISSDWAGSFAVGGGFQIFVPDSSILETVPLLEP